MQYTTALVVLLAGLSAATPIADPQPATAQAPATGLQVLDIKMSDNPTDLPTRDLTKRWSGVWCKKGSEMPADQWTRAIMTWCTQMSTLTVSKGKSLSMTLGGAKLSNGNPGQFIGTYKNDHTADWSVVLDDCTNLMNQIVAHCSQGGWYGIPDKGTVQVTAIGI